MAGFKAILGHEQIIEHLQNAVTMDKVSHAYIINGPDKSGKMMLAEAFAQTLECEKLEDVVKNAAQPSDVEPCMECHSCKQAMTKNQPDIIYVRQGDSAGLRCRTDLPESGVFCDAGAAVS